MEPKAYDLALLGAKLKSKGLEVAEESLKILLDSTIEWLDESAKISKNPIDDMLSAGYPYLQKMALEQIEKVNPADNEPAPAPADVG